MNDELLSSPPSPQSADALAEGAAEPVVPARAEGLVPLVGLGGSAGSIAALQAFFHSVGPGSGLAFVVVIHLAPDHESTLDQLLQRATTLKVQQVTGRTRVEPDTVYVIPPGKAIHTQGADITVSELVAEHAHPMAVDKFLRALADSHGPRGAAVILSGMGGDGANGLKRIKEHGGLTIAQDPDEAEHGSMPRSAIATGLVDWILPVREIPARLQTYFQMEKSLKLPAEEPPKPVEAELGAEDRHEAALRDVLSLLRTRTGRDFHDYKRATIVRRVARRMLVNATPDLPTYLACLRTSPGEAAALLQDLLISVTNFFRDPECFDALDTHLDTLFHGKGPTDTVRAWVAACATGEEAYSVAMLLADKARKLEAPPMVQVFATDIDEKALKVARDGLYPIAIDADVSAERLRRYFMPEHRGLRVRRELREMVLFAQHDVLKDSPFSRLDLIACRNLLIYLNRRAQERVFKTFHFALQPQGTLFLGASESAEEASSLFAVRDKKHRIYTQRSAPRPGVPVPIGPGSLALALNAQAYGGEGPALAGRAFQNAAAQGRALQPTQARSNSWGELHYKLLEALAPPSVLIDAEHEIVHLSAHAGRFLQFSGGEPSKNLLRAVHPDLRIELRAALHQAAYSHDLAEARASAVTLEGRASAITIRVHPTEEAGNELYLVTFSAQALNERAAPDGSKPAPAGADPLARQLDREIERLKTQLRDTVEQYEGSVEELKASNEELQAMNEELRSATEELETSREELQSINEELSTVNQELQSKVDLLGRANSDMQNLMDATAIATVFLDRELCVMRYTPSAVTLFNLIPSDLGRPLADLATHLDYPQLNDDARTVLGKLAPIQREVGLPGGQWYLTRILPYRTVDDRIGGVVMSFIDISQAKRAAEALRASEERLRLVIENAHDYAIFSMDLSRRITIWNTGAQRLLGYTEQEVLGQPADLIFTEEDRAAGVPELEASTALAEGRMTDDRYHRRKDGTLFWASGACMLMRDGQGKVLGFVQILRDQTAAREAHSALERSQTELQQALVENEKARHDLEAGDRAKDHFLAVLSHELRNPLASITNASELLTRPDLPPQGVQKAAQVVRRQSANMKAQLNDLLDISRLRLGHGLTLQCQPINLADCIESGIETTRHLIDAHRHTLEVQVPDEPIRMEGDPVRLSQVIANLLTNSAKYTHDGGRIAVSAHVAGDQAIIDVTDNGIGMNPADIEKMFELFSQASNPLDSRSGGLGIGLALSRSIVKMHDGTIVATSGGPGQGTQVRVTLSLKHKCVGPDNKAMTGTSSGNWAGAWADGPLVLIADDNEDSAWAMAELLGRTGLRTLVTNGGESALQLAEQHRPQAMLLDVGMPDLNGHEVARAIRAKPWGGSVALIAATGWGQDSDRRESLQAGFDAHLTKPLSAETVQTLIGELVRQRHGGAAPSPSAPKA